MKSTTRQLQTVQARAAAALKNLFVADALAMPVHWYYNPRDIEIAFPGGIAQLESAPDFHPSSIMSLHSTSQGGRGAQTAGRKGREIVGEVILKGRRHYWGQPNQHYHRGMLAGENTLNAHCARVLMRSLNGADGHYHKGRFLDAYIAFMIADPPAHSDTYAESYHRAFFANLEQGKPKDQCGALTHDTPSIGGLVTIAPLLIAERLRGTALSEVQEHCRQHLFLTHPDEELAGIVQAYVELLNNLLFRSADEKTQDFLSQTAKSSIGLDLPALVENSRDDREIVGGLFSSACYISGAWPSVLYLAYRYLHEPLQGLLANTNLGGDNVHRGAVLGTIFGAANGRSVEQLFHQLVDRQALEREINTLVRSAVDVDRSALVANGSDAE